MKRSFAFAFLCVIASLLAAASLASAHAFIDHCTPALGSTNAQLPKEVRCVFTDAVDAKQAHLQVFDAGNSHVDNNDLQSDPNDRDGKTLFVSLNTAKITGGVYTVKWDAVASDGDKTDGQWQFSVGAQAQPVPSLSITSPKPETVLDKAPSDVPVTIQVSNFALGQNNNHWQVLLDDEGTLAADVKDNRTTTTIKNLDKGDHLIKVVLLAGTTTVATDITTVTVGAEEQPTPAPAPSSAQQPAPQKLPTTGADNPADLRWAALLAFEGMILLVLARLLRRKST